MNVKPVKRYLSPKLPTRDVVDEQPDLLRMVPKRWRGNQLVLSALATACLLSAGCRSSKQSPARVAPVFEHGDGRGSFGCVAVNPPVFLSEDEARKVVEEEAKHAGITFTKPGPEVFAASVPVTDRYSHPPTVGTLEMTLELDGVDAKHRFAYEFVSQADLQAWERWSWGASTVSSYDTLGAAQVLHKGLSGADPRQTYAVFYDPAVGRHVMSKTDRWTVAKTRTELETRQVAREELRAQVRDFVKWLKAQGVI